MTIAITVALGFLLAILAYYFFFQCNRNWDVALRKTIRALEVGDVAAAKNYLRDAQDTVKEFPLDDPRALMVRFEEARLAARMSDDKRTIAVLEDILLSCAPDDNAELLLVQGTLPDRPKNKTHTNIFSRALFNLAEAEAAACNPSKAEELFKMTIRYREETYGSDSKDVAVALQQFATFLSDQGRVSEAKELNERAEGTSRRN